MNRNKFLALAMAGAMTLATAVPAYATGSSGTTEVSLTLSPKNTYTLTVPAKTALNSDGTVTELTNGIKITDGDLADGKKLTVTATSQNSWALTAEDVDTTISYALYSDDAAETGATSWEFTQAEANADEGTTKSVYAKPDATALSAAKSGEYSDVITFTAAVEDEVTYVSFSITKDGATNYYTVTSGTTWSGFLSSGAGAQYANDKITNGSGNSVNENAVIVAGSYSVVSYQ